MDKGNEVKRKRRPKQQQPRMVVQKQPKPKRYCPPPCSECTARRPEGSFTSVYRTIRLGRSVVRYCRCEFCGATFKRTNEAA